MTPVSVTTDRPMLNATPLTTRDALPRVLPLRYPLHSTRLHSQAHSITDIDKNPYTTHAQPLEGGAPEDYSVAVWGKVSKIEASYLHY